MASKLNTNLQDDGDDLRSCTSLAALAFEAANPLLSPRTPASQHFSIPAPLRTKYRERSSSRPIGLPFGSHPR
jgi:hypothetical protein